MNGSDRLPALRVGDGLSEWIEIEARLRDVPEKVIIETATKYPVPYMRANPVRLVPMVEPRGGRLTARQLVIGILAAIFLLSTYGMGIGTDALVFNPGPATVKPVQEDR